MIFRISTEGVCISSPEQWAFSTEKPRRACFLFIDVIIYFNVVFQIFLLIMMNLKLQNTKERAYLEIGECTLFMATFNILKQHRDTFQFGRRSTRGDFF